MSMYLTKKGKTKETKILTGRRLVDNKIMPALIYMVGRDNAISQQELVKKCFGTGFSDLQEMMLRQLLHQSLTFIRGSDEHKTFIVGYYDEIEGYKYYIPTTMDDVQEYKTRAQNRIRGIKAMVKRCERSVLENWWKDIGTDRISLK